jgi:hypothetical protein
MGKPDIQQLAKEIAADLAEDIRRGGGEREETEKVFSPLPKLDDASLQRIAQTLVTSEEAEVTLRKLFVALPTLDASGLRLVQEAIEQAEGLTSMQKSGGGRLRERQHPADDDADPEALRRGFASGQVRVTDIMKGRVAGVDADGRPRGRS